MKEEFSYGLKVVDKAYTGELINEYQKYIAIEDWERMNDDVTLDRIIKKSQEGDLKALYLVAIYAGDLAENKVEFLDKIGYDTMDEIWQDLAEKGFPLGQYVFAQRYYLRKDVASAKKWHERAANSGCTLSQLCLAYILIDEKKYDEALNWVEQAKDGKDAEAEINYLQGKIAIKRDVISNKTTAIEFFERAADLGSSAAMNQMFKMYRDMPSIRDETKAFKYATMSAELGDEIGVDNLCECYEKGIGVNENKKKALNILKNFGKNHNFTKDLQNRYERLSDECALDIGSQIAARTEIKKVNTTMLKVVAGLGVVMTIVWVVFCVVSNLPPAVFVLAGLMAALTGFLIYSIPANKKRNARIEKVNTYPEVAITYNNGSFFVVTDDVLEIKANEIARVSFVRTQNRSFVIGTLVSSVGNINIKLKNGQKIVVEQIVNAPASTKIMKKIIKSL